VASVLVIAVDPNIESLMGQLVAFAGHRPSYDATSGAGGESLRRTRPDIVLLDNSLPRAILTACLQAADEIGANAVLTSSTDNEIELAAEADARHCLYFALPGGPRPLARTIERALTTQRRELCTLPLRHHSANAIHPALCAALAGVARARMLDIRLEALRHQNRLLREDVQESLEETQRSRLALRAAIFDYSNELKGSSVPELEALVLVQDAVHDCAAVVGADDEMRTLLLESEAWTLEAYRTV
jgi:DNA-binding NtrC family response regulator